MAAAAGALGAWLNLVGPASTAITKIVSLSSQLPAVSNFWQGADPSGDSGVVVTVGVGMYEGGDQNNFGGSGLKVSGFTSQGTFTGNGQFPHMDQGVAKGLNLGSASSPEAWQLTLTVGGSDAVCVQYVELAWQGTITSGFDGTWGRDCGQDWYYSQSTWGQIDGVPYRPDCFWFAEGKGAKHPLQEMWVDMEKMVAGAPVVGSNSSTETYCNDQAMKFSSTKGDGTKNPVVPDGLTQDKQGSGPAPGVVAPWESTSAATPTASPPPDKRGEAHHPHLPPGKRALSSTGTSAGVHNVSPVSTVSAKATETGSYRSSNGTSSGPERVLVISDIEAHSAEDLCASDYARGPDFVSQYEKKFCDMATRTIYPLCDGSVQTDCFDVDQAGKTLRKRGGAEDGTTKGYKNVHNWSSNDVHSSRSVSGPGTK